MKLTTIVGTITLATGLFTTQNPISNYFRNHKIPKQTETNILMYDDNTNGIIDRVYLNGRIVISQNKINKWQDAYQTISK